MPQLDFTTYSSQIFWFLICFTVLFLFLNKVIIPRIAAILKERQDSIDNNLEETNKLQNEIDELTQTNDSLRKEANNAYKTKIEEVKKDAQQNRQKLIDEMKVNIENTANSSRQELKEFVAKIDSEAQNATNNLVKQIREKLIN